jgi:hypothetical protein
MEISDLKKSNEKFLLHKNPYTSTVARAIFMVDSTAIDFI